MLLNNKLNEPFRRVIYQMCKDQNSSFRTIKERMIQRDAHLVTVEYFPFYVTEYLKYGLPGELFGDVLLVTLIRNPLNRIFSDLLFVSGAQALSDYVNVHRQRILTPDVHALSVPSNSISKMLK